VGAIDAARWQKLEPLLDEALQLPVAERAHWLSELRERSAELADTLSALLAEQSAADSSGFLAEPFKLPLSGASLAGFQLGSYTLERPIGDGGMGSVWLARRADGRFEGTAAIKLLTLALLTPEGQQRFRREGSFLAKLGHPGIARLLDAGVAENGQPYLVLEHVDGTPIDVFADQQRLTLAQRMRLVLQVLSAVGHAHANLIVHRDLKPSNILVTKDGTAKLLDFGIAKLLAEEGDLERTALTRGWALTPDFAAPEQVRGGTITTGTDIYSTGVLLYRLLTGRKPYELAGHSAVEILRIVCETQPPRPSATFGRLAGDDVTERARVRGGTPDRLQRQLMGDLDAIVMKALHKEPERRYASASALAEDIQRHLDGRPVAARPDRFGYRARKFVLRHRAGVATAGAAVVLLAGAAVRERTLRTRAEKETQKAKAVEGYLGNVFGAADPFAPAALRREVTARALLDRGAAQIDAVLPAQPDVQAELRAVLGRVYISLGVFDKAAALLERSLEQRRSLYGAQHVAVAESMDLLGEALAGQDQFDRAEALLREALAQRRALLGSTNSATAETIDHLAVLMRKRNNYQAAEPLLREALAIRRALHGPDSIEVASALNDLGVLLYVKGNYDEAERLYREALAIHERRAEENNPVTAQVLQNLAQIRVAKGHPDEGEALYRRALAIKQRVLGSAHPSATLTANNLGNLLVRMGRPDEAEPLVRQALASDRQTFGEQHAYVAESMKHLATVLRAQGKFDEAEQMFREALALNRKLFGNEHSSVASNLSNLAIVLQLKDQLGPAIQLFRESQSMFQRVLGEKHPYYRQTSINLAKALRESGQPREAEDLLRTVSGELDPANEVHRPLHIEAQVGLGRALMDQGRTLEALPILEQASEMSTAALATDDLRRAEARLVLGMCLIASRQYERADPLVREADAVLQKRSAAHPRLSKEAAAALAQLDRGLGNR